MCVNNLTSSQEVRVTVPVMIISLSYENAATVALEPTGLNSEYGSASSVIFFQYLAQDDCGKSYGCLGLLY
jgi:hypothetical protein